MINAAPMHPGIKINMNVKNDIPTRYICKLIIISNIKAIIENIKKIVVTLHGFTINAIKEIIIKIMQIGPELILPNL